jgi:hypothetical protein
MLEKRFKRFNLKKKSHIIPTNMTSQHIIAGMLIKNKIFDQRKKRR